MYILDDSKSREELYNNKKVVYNQYAWGVWTTAHARAALQAAIDRCGDNLLYCDTDSVKFLGVVDFGDYNEERIAECLESGAHAADRHGEEHYMGVFEHDASYSRFVTLGAKKYAYEDETGLHITVSGVSKKKGAAELAARGGLEAFQPGFVFSDSGKTEIVYNDDMTRTKTTVDGEAVEITKNAVIRETTYTLSITDDYEQLLCASSKMLNKVHEHWLNCQLQ